MNTHNIHLLDMHYCQAFSSYEVVRKVISREINAFLNVISLETQRQHFQNEWFPILLAVLVQMKNNSF